LQILTIDGDMVLGTRSSWKREYVWLSW